MSELHLLGIDNRTLGHEVRAVLARVSTLFTTERFRPLVGEFRGEVLAITPLSQALERMAERLATSDVAVLASGDPLFFGIGRTLLQRFGPARVVVHPALSAMQLAFARLKEPWDDAAFLSLHGRPGCDLLPHLLQRPKLFLFTDQHHRPEEIASDLAQGLADLEIGEERCRVMVAEALGTPDERITQGTPSEIAAFDFGPLNVMIIRLATSPGPVPAFRLGLSEAEIAHSRGLITKDEVRAAILHGLRLPEEGVLWDIGAGSGSISIEAARLCPGLSVWSVERHPEQLAHINKNRKAYQLANLRLVDGQAPAALGDLPAPDRVFIGGSGGELAAIVALVCERLKPHGILMASAVTEATREQAPALFLQHGLQVAITTLQVSRQSYPPAPGGPIHLNPITLITGSK